MTHEPSAPGTRRWTAFVLVAAVLLTVLLWTLRAWVWLGVEPINAERTPWSDTLVHLGTAVNCANGLGQWHGRVCFVPNIDAVPRAQTYEPWLSLYRLGIDSEPEALAIAWAMVLAFCLAYALLLQPRTAGQALLALAVFLTAGVQLAIERGNFDLAVFVLLCLAALGLAERRAAPALAGIAALALATVLKLYTGLACLFAWLATPAPRRWSLPAGLAGVLLAVAVVGPRELLVLAGGAPEGATRFSTGARWLWLHAGPSWAVAALMLAAATALFVTIALLRVPAPVFARWPRRRTAFLLAFATAAPLFLLKDSYDYRLVLWLPCLALPFAWLGNAAVARRWRCLGASLVALFLLVAGIELPCTWLDRLAAEGVSWAAPLAQVLALLKQFAAWLLLALSAVLAARLLLAQTRAMT
jgi:hypothetical protein